MIENKNYVVYAHYTPDSNELFYIGEGRPKRPCSRQNRNRYWNHKVNKHGGFKVEILYDQLTKPEAERIEAKLITKYKSEGHKLVNFCEGPLYGPHWTQFATKEQMPMYGKKIPAASERMKSWNKERRGELSPVWGIKRPDLAERNRTGTFNRYSRPVYCKELDMTFSSIKDAKSYINKPGINIHRALKEGSPAGGYHWAYVSPR